MTNRATAQPALFDTPATPTPATHNTWLRDHLIRSGHLTETGLTRQARLRPCPNPTCHALILTGLDNDRCALEARTDPTPLTPLGEALAAIDNRRTYDLRREGPGWVLDPRDHDQITFAPAGTQPRRDVLRQHRCHTPDPAGPATIPSAFGEVRARINPDAPAPF